MARPFAFFIFLATFAFVLLGGAASSAGGLTPLRGAEVAPAELTKPIARDLFSLPSEPVMARAEEATPGWAVSLGGELIGHIASTWEITRSVGYSGRPIDMLVAVSAGGKIAGARLMRHSEPILTLGLSDADIARFVNGFAGVDLMSPDGGGDGPDMPDIISRATVSTGVIRDSILRTARILAISRGLVPGGGIDRVSFSERDWRALVERGDIVSLTVTMADARAGLPGAKPPIPDAKGPFIQIWAGLIDPPSIGQNLLGQQQFTRAVGALGPQEAILFVASRGLYSHRGAQWRRSGVFDRLTVVQNGARLTLSDEGYTRIDKLPKTGAPQFKERSQFRVAGADFDPKRPFSLELTASRDAAGGETVSFVSSLGYALPRDHIQAPPPEATPLWREAWVKKKFAVATVVAMLAALTLILLFQEALVRRPRLWRITRLSYLSVTLVWLGWVLNGQLSVVQVVAFVQSMLSGFRWETFLIEPVIFTLWGFVALGLLFWGRGVFCGWLCPFGALQELTNALARRLKVPQISVPHALHERLWMIKYTLFVSILALSFYSMVLAVTVAEAEPFKTAISLRMMRAWPFVAFVLALLVAGLFIERFYCRYLCPLGAALAIPASLKIFDWLHRRPQCGRECRLCETRCTVGAIDPLGRINPNECVLCLRCQVVMNDHATCPVLRRRARAKPVASGN